MNNPSACLSDKPDNAVRHDWSRDEVRAIFALPFNELLFQAQWRDGLLPHVIFHRPSPDYFPGPEIWGTEGRADLPGTGISLVARNGLRIDVAAGFDAATLQRVLTTLEMVA